MRNLVLAAAAIGGVGCARPEPEPPGPWLARIPLTGIVRVDPEPPYAGTAVIGRTVPGGELRELAAGSRLVCADDSGPEEDSGRLVDVWALAPETGAWKVQRWQVRYSRPSRSGGGAAGSGRGPRP